jgi:peptide/nickel transport system permease protein
MKGVQNSRFMTFWKSYKKNRLSVLAFWVAAGMILLAFLAPLITPYDPTSVGVGKKLSSVSSEFLMGTDHLGRDVLSRVLMGTRTSLFIGFSAAAASTLIGVLMGTMAGFFSGMVDNILMRVTELFQVIPRFFLAILTVALFGANIWNIIFALGVLSWPVTARLVRSEFLSQRKRYFVDAAILQGASTWNLIFTEILPNVSGVIVVNSTLMVAQAMLMEASMSYLGAGDPSTISWGMMLYQAQQFLDRAWWMSLFPGLGIFLSVLALNLVGDGLNDVLNPRSQDTKGMIL